MKLRTLVFAAALAPAVAFATDTRSAQPAANPPATDAVNGTPPPNTATGNGVVNAEEKMSDARLASMLHRVNKMEIDAGNLAAKHGASAGIKDYGTKLKADHTAADNKLMAAAKRESIDLDALAAADKAKLDVDMKKMDQVKKMKGAEFDKAFASVMYNGHDDVLNMLDRHEGDIQSSALKQWVKDARPVLERHKQMADKLRGENRAQAR
ncbi:MAG: DUF4142 domain-containing protein [Myxococcales bacterium]|nr:DUF4142 domain-containing protein [Myxococcales bacterium]